ncbi:MAG: MobC family plasmid mobilization relaxosome protein [Coriobacteriia bacterium]|nr:MobC family plasmid mobilization relaxosome protein [Coriobacteriia bacterium]
MASLPTIHIRLLLASKGGSPMRARSEQVNLRLNQKEIRRLDVLARRCNLTRSAYLRHLINGMVPKEAPPTDYYRMMREIHAIGNNLNQLVHRVHCTGELDVVRIEAAIRELRQSIQVITKEIIEPAKHQNVILSGASAAEESSGGDPGFKESLFGECFHEESQ